MGQGCQNSGAYLVENIPWCRKPGAGLESMERGHWNLGPRLARQDCRFRRKKRLCRFSNGRRDVRTDCSRGGEISKRDCRSLCCLRPNRACLVELRMEQDRKSVV